MEMGISCEEEDKEECVDGKATCDWRTMWPPKRTRPRMVRLSDVSIHSIFVSVTIDVLLFGSSLEESWSRPTFSYASLRHGIQTIAGSMKDAKGLEKIVEKMILCLHAWQRALSTRSRCHYACRTLLYLFSQDYTNVCRCQNNIGDYLRPARSGRNTVIQEE